MCFHIFCSFRALVGALIGTLIGTISVLYVDVLAGVLYIRATRVGSNTAIAQIVRLVEEAQTTKAPIQHFADRVSSIFAPTVFTLSIFTFLLWWMVLSSGYAPDAWVEDAQQSGSNFVFSFLFGIAVLVIACPCALGLATPTAVMVSVNFFDACWLLLLWLLLLWLLLLWLRRWTMTDQHVHMDRTLGNSC